MVQGRQERNFAGPVVYLNAGPFFETFYPHPKEVFGMGISRACKFYRDSGTINMGKGIGYCDLDCDQTTCEGDIDFCENPISLKTYLIEQMKREGGLEWERKRNVRFSGNQKV
jgi:hypothetical protein